MNKKTHTKNFTPSPNTETLSKNNKNKRLRNTAEVSNKQDLLQFHAETNHPCFEYTTNLFLDSHTNTKRFLIAKENLSSMSSAIQLWRCDNNRSRRDVSGIVHPPRDFRTFKFIAGKIQVLHHLHDFAFLFYILPIFNL